MAVIYVQVSVCVPLFESYLFFSFQLIDLREVFSSTKVEFLRSALSCPQGCVQAICVPEGAVRKLFTVTKM